ncbi:hypothetical protein QVD99_001905 [Batrachochytrium dendrobatidis]|nr:hypothetical protein O5D80_000547 [Batrachochytrium dendrobatidis]KAK5672094.1 hypothetical protein QVD99_001905 [Batrachochytrium dendrobatidis]
MSVSNIDALVSAIEDPTIKPKGPATICGMRGCKEKLNMLSVTCDLCSIRFCMAHRLPEVHSTTCSEQKKQQTHKTTKQDASLLMELNKRGARTLGKSSGANLSVAAEKERANARAALHKKIDAASKSRTKSSIATSSNTSRKSKDA